MSVIAKNRWAGGRGYALAVRDNRAYILVNNCWAGALVEGSIPAPDDQWTHIAGTWSSSGVMTIYVNGVLDVQLATQVTDIRFSTFPLVIGSEDSVGGHQFNGLIDEPSVYNVALTSTRIAAIYASESAGKCEPTVHYLGCSTDSASRALPNLLIASGATARVVRAGRPAVELFLRRIAGRRAVLRRRLARDNPGERLRVRHAVLGERRRGCGGSWRNSIWSAL